MRVLVCGSRECENWGRIQQELDNLRIRNKVDVIIHGGAPGVDKLAGVYARRNNIVEEVYEADWDKYGKSAGPVRNKQMLDEGKPDLVVAFPTVDSKGTRDMINQTEKRKINLIVHDI